MNKSRLSSMLVSLLLTFSSICAFAQAPLETRLTELALERNPDLSAARFDWQQAEEQMTVADSLDDPILSLSLQNYPVDSLAYDESPMTGNEIRLAQKFPFPGKLAARAAIAEQTALSKKEALFEKRLLLSRSVRETYYRYLLQNSILAILDETQNLLTDLIRSFEVTYATGKTSQQQILSAQQQQTRLLERLVVEKSRRASLLGALNRLIPGDLPNRELEQGRLPRQLPELPDLQKGVDRALEQRPVLQLYGHLERQSIQQAKLAKLDKNPDFTLWTSYRFRDGGPMDSVQGADMVSVGVSFNLPYFNSKRQAQERAANHMKNRARAERDNSRDQIRFNLEEAHRQMTRLREQINLYEQGLIPQTQTAWQAAISSYQQSRSAYQQPLEILLQLFNQQLTLEQLRGDYLVNLSWFKAETGELLP